MNELRLNNKNQLFNINTDNERITLSARELHEFLEIETPFKKWFDRMTEYGFTENSDYVVLDKNVHNPLGGRPGIDFQITLEMGKEIAMLQRSDKGKEVRQYFIELEKAWNSPEQVMARGLAAGQKMIDNLKNLLAEAKPKIDFYDSVADSKTAIPMDQVAKVLSIRGVGRNKLFELLRNLNILQKNNIPYQEYVDRGYFRVVETKYTKPNGETYINIKTLVYQKGVDYIRRKLEGVRND